MEKYFRGVDVLRKDIRKMASKAKKEGMKEMSYSGKEKSEQWKSHHFWYLDQAAQNNFCA